MLAGMNSYVPHGSFQYVQQQIQMVMDDNKLRKYKTVMCQRMFQKGTCRYGILCDFAHDDDEMRRNLNQHWYYGIKCEKENCKDKECQFSHGEMEILYHPHNYKTKMCQAYMKGSGCPKKNYCSFAHGRHELRQPKFNAEVLSGLPNGNGGFDTASVSSSSAAVMGHYSPDSPASPFTPSPSQPFPAQSAPAPQQSQQAQAQWQSPSPVPQQQQQQQQQPQQQQPSASHQLLAQNQSQSAPAPLLEPSRDFREVTDGLKIQILDMVDNLCNMYYSRGSEDLNNGPHDVMAMNGMLQQSMSTIQKQREEQYSMVEQHSRQLEELSEHCMNSQSLINELQATLKDGSVSDTVASLLMRLQEQQKTSWEKIVSAKEHLAYYLPLQTPAGNKEDGYSLEGHAMNGALEHHQLHAGHEQHGHHEGDYQPSIDDNYSTDS